MGVKSTGRACEKSRQNKREHFDTGNIHAHRLGAELILAHRYHRPSESRSLQSECYDDHYGQERISPKKIGVFRNAKKPLRTSYGRRNEIAKRCRANFIRV